MATSTLKTVEDDTTDTWCDDDGEAYTVSGIVQMFIIQYDLMNLGKHHVKYENIGYTIYKSPIQPNLSLVKTESTNIVGSLQFSMTSQYSIHYHNVLIMTMFHFYFSAWHKWFEYQEIPPHCSTSAALLKSWQQLWCRCLPSYRFCWRSSRILHAHPIHSKPAQ